MTRICHLSTVHNAFDTRILWKECASLVNAGFEVILIAPVKEANQCHAVKIIPFPPFHLPFLRMLFAPWLMLFKALRVKAALYHFHDPELIPAAMLLKRLTRRPVIYDVHEDVAASIQVREYIPNFLRSFLAWGYRRWECLAAKAFHIILAERYYADFLPGGTCILNYPLLGTETQVKARPEGKRSVVRESPPCWLLYSGAVSRARGALHHARTAGLHPQVGIYSAGSCDVLLAAEMKTLAPTEKLVIEGEGKSVPRQRLDELANQYEWLAGLAVFPYSEHYQRKELTKFFEYMLAGIPILCSDFPAWKEFVEGQGIGLTVNPEDVDDQLAKIIFLLDHPDKRQAMGEKGRRLVLEMFNWEQEAVKLTGLYRRILE